MKPHLRRSKKDENIVVSKYYEQGNIATRIGGSGSGRFKGDVFAIVDNAIELSHVRRSERNLPIEFCDSELHDIIHMKHYILRLLSNAVKVVALLRCHFPKKRRWVHIELVSYFGGGITIYPNGLIISENKNNVYVTRTTFF